MAWKLRCAIGTQDLRKALLMLTCWLTRRKTLPLVRKHGSIRSLNFVDASPLDGDRKFEVRDHGSLRSVGDDSAHRPPPSKSHNFNSPPSTTTTPSVRLQQHCLVKDSLWLIYKAFSIASLIRLHSNSSNFTVVAPSDRFVNKSKSDSKMEKQSAREAMPSRSKDVDGKMSKEDKSKTHKLSLKGMGC